MDNGMLEFHKQSTYSQVDPSLAEQWRRRLSLRQIGLVEARASTLMMSRGYAPVGRSAKPGYLVQGMLAAHNKMKTWQFAIRQYGFLLVASEKVSRRLGLTRMRHTAVKRMHVITKRYLK
jgi:hypothetical protein